MKDMDQFMKEMGSKGIDVHSIDDLVEMIMSPTNEKFTEEGTIPAELLERIRKQSQSESELEKLILEFIEKRQKETHKIIETIFDGRINENQKRTGELKKEVYEFFNINKDIPINIDLNTGVVKSARKKRTAPFLQLIKGKKEE